MDISYALMSLLYLIPLSFGSSTAHSSNKIVPIGVILDLDTPLGKMAQTSITMAVEDFYTLHSNYSTRIVLYTRDSNNSNVQATLAALDLIQSNRTEVIIGPQKSSQAVIVSEIGTRSRVPVISFSATSPTLSSMQLPYFVRATINDIAQLDAITSLITACGWQEVVPIYEDSDFGRAILPFLVDALEDINVRIPYHSSISKLSTDDQIKQELYKLQTMQTRVFVVHMSSTLGSNLFLKAKEVGMMSQGYAWIMTNGVTNMLDSFNETVTNAMRGALGVQLHVPKTVKLNKFTTKWKKRFLDDSLLDMSNEPNIYALWAYDTIYALAMTVEKVVGKNSKIENSAATKLLHVSSDRPQLLEVITTINFQGLSGNFKLINGELQYSSFKIINIVGHGIREVGYWKEEQGLSREIDGSNNKSFSTSLDNLNPIIWPGETIVIPKGWEIPVSGKKLRVGVTVSSYPEFMRVKMDPEKNSTTAIGYSIDVFEAAVKRLPYAVPYEYEHFGGTSGNSSLTYNDLVYQVYLGKYDIVIGDITIRYNRTRYADFSVPYTDSGVAMLVPVKTATNKNTSIFLKPLTADLWIGSIVFIVYTGIAILILEPNIRASLKGTFSGHLGTIMHLSLFGYQEKLENILSKIVIVVWVFVLLVLASSYTASLTSMLTVQQLQPKVTDIYDLKKNGNYVGYKKGSFVEGLLQQIGFDRSKIRGYYPEEFAEALDKGSSNGGVAAIVHEVPYIKLFLAKYCKSYTMVGPIYKTASFGFAFPKGSPLAADISRAILNITDGDDIFQIEKKWIRDETCLSSSSSNTVDSNSLNFLNFWGLFLITGIVSTICLVIFATMSLYKQCKKKIHQISLQMSSNEITEVLPTMDQKEDQVRDAAGLPSDESETGTSPIKIPTIRS